MRILLALIPISLVLLGIAIAFFAWAVRNDQFEDLDSAALDVLTDDTRPAPPIVCDAPATNDKMGVRDARDHDAGDDDAA